MNYCWTFTVGLINKTFFIKKVEIKKVKHDFSLQLCELSFLDLD